jgi:hypothetical protein
MFIMMVDLEPALVAQAEIEDNVGRAEGHGRSRVGRQAQGRSTDADHLPSPCACQPEMTSTGRCL